MRFLVTAGSTREQIDEVRDWGNIFTGNTGFGIAKALASAGRVELLTSNRQHLEAARSLGLAHEIEATAFSTHEELLGLLEERMMGAAYDAVVMSAAIADYRPSGCYEVQIRHPDPSDPQREHWIVRNVQAGKVKSSYRRLAIMGRPTEKLVDLFRTRWGFKGILVKFKLEVGIEERELLAIGEASRVASGADYLVANTLEMVHGERPGAFVLDANGHVWVARAELPRVLVERLGGKELRKG